MTDYTPVTDHAARLRHLAIDLEGRVWLDVSEEASQLRTAADHIEELEKENQGRCVMTDHTARLREIAAEVRHSDLALHLLAAADRIDELEADNERLRGRAWDLLDAMHDGDSRPGALGSAVLHLRMALNAEDGAS